MGRTGRRRYPVGAGAATVICPAYANRAPPDQPALLTWSRDGKFVYLHETGLRQTYAVPLRLGQALRRMPPAGVVPRLPYDSGLAFVKDEATLKSAMSVTAACLPQGEHREPSQ